MKPRLEQEAAEVAESSFSVFSAFSAISCSNAFCPTGRKSMKLKLEQEEADTLRAKHVGVPF